MVPLSHCGAHLRPKRKASRSLLKKSGLCATFGLALLATLPQQTVAVEHEASTDSRRKIEVQRLESGEHAANGDDQSGANESVVPRLNLETLQTMAFGANPSIQRAMALVSAARGTMLQVGLQANPEVGFEGQQLGSDGRAEQYGVSFGQEFIRPEKRYLNRAVASHEVNRLEQELAVQQGRVRTDVTISFYRALRAERQVAMTTDLVAISEKALAAARALEEAKEVGHVDVLQAEIEIETSRVQREAAENRHITAWRELAAVTGHSDLAMQPLEGELDGQTAEIDFDQVLAALRSESPEVAAALASIERARCKLRREQVEPLPNLTAQGLINWRDNGIGGDPDAGVALSVPIPLWNRNQGAIHQAYQELNAASHALSQIELDLQNRLAPVFERYGNARAQVRRFQESILPKSTETLALTRKTYEAGEIGFVSLLTAQRTYAQTQLAYLDAVEALRVSEAEIDGMLLTDSLTLREAP